jgi:hypothetical protein
MNPLVKRGSRVSVALLTVAWFFAVLALICCKTARKLTGNSGFDLFVKSTQPLAYYRLESTSGSSEVGKTTYQSTGGVTNSSAGAPIGMEGNHCVRLDGKDGWITTTQTGGIGKAGSIMVWVNLAALPSDDRKIKYVVGESEAENDFDVQIEANNEVKFYTAAGSAVTYKPDAKTLVNQWHLIVGTMDIDASIRVLYWDGQPVAQDKDAGKPMKTGKFTIGKSSVFHERFFNGAIDEVAIWDRALSPADVTAIYQKTTTSQ